MKQFIEAGEIVTTHGVMGEVKLYPWCDGPEFIAALPRLFFTPEGGEERKLSSVRAHKNMCILKFVGVEGIDATRPYIGKVAYFARADAPLPEGRFFAQDIIGCAVKNADTGEEYGAIAGVTHPANCDIYEVKNSAGKSFLFPAVPEFLVDISPENNLVTVRPIAGMFTDAEGCDDAD